MGRTTKETNKTEEYRSVPIHDNGWLEILKEALKTRKTPWNFACFSARLSKNVLMEICISLPDNTAWVKLKEWKFEET